MDNKNLSNLLNECYIDEKALNNIIKRYEESGSLNLIDPEMSFSMIDNKFYWPAPKSKIRWLSQTLRRLSNRNYNVYIPNRIEFIKELEDNLIKIEYWCLVFLFMLITGTARGTSSGNIDLSIKAFLKEYPQDDILTNRLIEYVSDRNILDLMYFVLKYKKVDPYKEHS